VGQAMPAGEADLLLQTASTINPHHQRFHVH
jgi:hypothetical protein